MQQPSFSVYLNRERPLFVISLQFEGDHGVAYDTGPLIRYDDDQMKLHGLRLAEEHFVAFATKKADEPSDFKAMSDEERTRFLKQHKNIFVYLESEKQIVMWPTENVKRRNRLFTIALDPDDAIRVRRPTTPKRFFDSLMRAFTNAR